VSTAVLDSRRHVLAVVAERTGVEYPIAQTAAFALNVPVWAVWRMATH
jgi:hypothetical protein